MSHCSNIQSTVALFAEGFGAKINFHTPEPVLIPHSFSTKLYSLIWNDQQFLISMVLPLMCDAETANWNYQLSHPHRLSCDE